MEANVAENVFWPTAEVPAVPVADGDGTHHHQQYEERLMNSARRRKSMR